MYDNNFELFTCYYVEDFVKVELLINQISNYPH